MKAYFEPKMNISVFDTENVITTSNGGVISDQLKTGKQYGLVDYTKLGNTTQVKATMDK